MPKPLRLNDTISARAFTDAETIDRWRTEASSTQAAEVGDTTITIYDVIGFDWWTGGGVTAKRINAALRKIGDRDVTVNINSPGGDVFEGVNIYNELIMHPGKVSVNIVGNASSAASLVAMAGDTIMMATASTMMIHEVSSGIFGTAAKQREVADYTDKINSGTAEVYAERTGKPVAEIMEKMSVGTLNLGTWFTAQEAVDYGLADGHYEGGTKSAEPKVANSLAHTKRDAELRLTNAGWSRGEARAFLNKIAGTQDAAPAPAKQDAGEQSAILNQIAKLNASLRS